MTRPNWWRTYKRSNRTLPGLTIQCLYRIKAQTMMAPTTWVTWEWEEWEAWRTSLKRPINYRWFKIRSTLIALMVSKRSQTNSEDRKTMWLTMTLPSTLKCKHATSITGQSKENKSIGRTGKCTSHRVGTMRYRPRLKIKSRQSSNLLKMSLMCNANAWTKIWLKIPDIWWTTIKWLTQSFTEWMRWALE